MVFDVSLSLSCFFGIGKLMQRYDLLRLGVLAVGGLVVLHIGAGLLFARKHGQSSDNIAQSRNTAHQVASRFGGDNELLSTIITAGVVTWLNPQAIIDGTLMLGAFSARSPCRSPRRSSRAWNRFRTMVHRLTLLIQCSAISSARKVIGFMNRRAVPW